MEARLNLYFLLKYLWSLAEALFQRKTSKDLDVEIAAVEEVLACAHKLLQDLKIRNQQPFLLQLLPPLQFLQRAFCWLASYLSAFYFIYLFIYFF